MLAAWAIVHSRHAGLSSLARLNLSAFPHSILRAVTGRPFLAPFRHIPGPVVHLVPGPIWSNEGPREKNFHDLTYFFQFLHLSGCRKKISPDSIIFLVVLLRRPACAAAIRYIFKPPPPRCVPLKICSRWRKLTVSEDDGVPLEALLKRVSQGDEIARDELVDRCARKFEGFTKYFLSVGRCWDRDVHGREISQSLWPIVFKDPASLSEVKCFVPWARAILKNLVREHFRGPKGCKKAPLPIDELDLRGDLPAAVINPAHVTIEYNVLWGEICEEAERIRPEFRQILELHFVEGFTHDEIGSMLDMTPNSVRLIYSRGLKELRPFLGDRETMTRSGALQLRPEPERRPPTTFRSGSADDFRPDLSGPFPCRAPEKPGLNARGQRVSRSRGGVKEKQERLSAYRRRKGRRTPDDGSGKRRTR